MTGITGKGFGVEALWGIELQESRASVKSNYESSMISRSRTWHCKDWKQINQIHRVNSCAVYIPWGQSAPRIIASTPNVGALGIPSRSRKAHPDRHPPKILCRFFPFRVAFFGVTSI